jgi:hypothetical protein
MKKALRLITASSSLSRGQGSITRLQLGDHIGSNIYERATRTLKAHPRARMWEGQVYSLVFIFYLELLKKLTAIPQDVFDLFNP